MQTDLPRGIGKAATGALVHAGHARLAQLTKLTERYVADLHGVGPKAIGVLRAALAERGLSFKAEGAARKTATKKPAPKAATKKPAPKKKAAGAKPASGSAAIDAYLAKVPAVMRAALEALRKQLGAAAPEAEEGVTYGVPALRIAGGGPIISFGASSKHCALYVMSPAVMEAHTTALKGLDTSKGTIRFAPDAPLPAALVKKLVKARLAEIAARKK